MRIFGSSTSPGSVVVKRQAFFTIGPIRKMLALANLLPLIVEAVAFNAFVSMSVAFAASAHGNIGDSIEVRL